MASEEGGVGVASAPAESARTSLPTAQAKQPHASLVQRASSTGSFSDFSSASASSSLRYDDEGSSPVVGASSFSRARGLREDDGDEEGYEDLGGGDCAGRSEYPAAPPTTPLSHASSSSASSLMLLNLDGMATPLPVLGNAAIQNASLLVEEQKRQWREDRLRQQEMLLLQDGGMTPLPDYRDGKDDGGDTDESRRSGSEGADGGADQDGAAAASSTATDSQGGAGSTLGRQSQHLPEDFSEWAVGDRYELVRMLGRGSYGEVAQAIDLSAGRKDAFVAIKRIQSPFDQEIDAIRLYREIHILRRMRGHDCIIQLLDIVQPPTDDLDDFHDLYMVFECTFPRTRTCVAFAAHIGSTRLTPCLPACALSQTSTRTCTS